MDLRVDSFLIRSKEFKINSLANVDEVFVNIQDYELINKNDLDYDYLEGAIRIYYRGEELLGFKNWDLIDQLWNYFIDAFIKLSKNEKVKFSFPDQPFEVIIENKNSNFIYLKLGERVCTIEKVYFVQNMIESARLFFEFLVKIFPEYEYFINYSMEKIEEARYLYIK